MDARYIPEHTDFVELGKDLGCVVALGSDSHSIETIEQLDYQRKLATDLELELANIEDLIS